MKPEAESKDQSWGRISELGGTSVGVLLLFLAAVTVTAQIYSVVHDFGGTPVGGDGSSPKGGLVESGGTLYGTTWGGGSNNWGTVFKLNLDGSGYTVLKHFTGNDGGPVDDPLTVSDQTLYGTAGRVLFKLNTDGSDFMVLRRRDSEYPKGPLVLIGTNLYGTTDAVGDTNLGTVFRISTEGNDFTVLKSFSGDDGAHPIGGLLLADNRLFGTTYAGGISNAGVIFQLNTDGSGFTVIKHFTVKDGAKPRTGMLLSGTWLYGTTSSGGRGVPTLGGTIFKINTDGEGFTVLEDFSARTGVEGNNPGGLALSGTTLYGTTYNGGVVNPQRGVLCKLSTDGSGYIVLRYFNSDSWGMNPHGSLVLANGALYGTTQFGGRYGGGVLFALSLTTPTALPESQTAEIGSTAWFAVESPRFWSANYQWFLQATNAVSGVSPNSRLQLTNLTANHCGLYSAVITQAGGTMTSSPVRLNIIPRIERRGVPGISVPAASGSPPQIESADALGSSSVWTPLDTVITNLTRRYLLDVSAPLPAQRFYRGWQTNDADVMPTLDIHMIPALEVTGSAGNKVRVDGINAIGPTDAWFTLGTITLTNSSQYYFDTSAIGQPRRLYRLVPLP